MESFMGGAILIEVAFLSFLLALWVTWLGLNGSVSAAAGHEPQCIANPVCGEPPGAGQEPPCSHKACRKKIPSTSGSTDSRERR